MKSLLMGTLLTLAATTSNALVYVQSAKLDENKSNVIVEVLYSGGCSRHHFSLEIEDRFESHPLEIQARIKEISSDKCSLTIPATLVFSLAEHNLNKMPVSFLSLNIKGDLASEVKVALPKHQRGI